MGATYVNRVTVKEADDGDGIVDVWHEDDPAGDHISFGGGGTYLEADALNWTQGRWWRALGPDGKVWAEASNEAEVRSLMRPGDTLFNDRRAEVIEWVEIKVKS